MPVLISYSRADIAQALLVRRALAQKGIQVWLDDHDIEFGEIIQKRLEQMIWQCDMMLVLITPNSLISKWIEWEISAALAREALEGRELILPIVLLGDGIPDALKDRKYADFRTQESQERNFSSLVRQLLTLQSGEDPSLANTVDLFTPRGLPSLPPTPTTLEEEPEEDPSLVYLKSPIVGTFYLAPSPDAAPYVKIGDRVQKGQVVVIIEAMKLMNEIESPVDGVVVKILRDDQQPIEFDEPLMAFKPFDD